MLKKISGTTEGQDVSAPHVVPGGTS